MSNQIMWYILDEDNKPVASDLQESVLWMNINPNKKIVNQDQIGNVFISTVFLGLDHSIGDKTPILWETMIFRGKKSVSQTRYTSYEDAVEGHKKSLNSINESRRYNKIKK